MRERIAANDVSTMNIVRLPAVKKPLLFLSEMRHNSWSFVASCLSFAL